MATPRGQRYLLALLALAVAGNLFAANPILPARQTDWTAGTITGVIGGIPAPRTTVFAAGVMATADNTGVADASPTINNVIANCPGTQVVQLPAGTFKIATRLGNSGVPSNITIRGAGPGLTILKPTGAIQVIYAGTAQTKHAGVTVTSGATKGSTSITVASTTGIVANELIRIEASSPPSYVHGESNPPASPTPSPAPTGSSGGTMGWMFRIASVPNGTTINFFPPLPMDISGMSPVAAAYTDYGATNPLVGVGIEDLTIDDSDNAGTGNAMTAGILINQGYNCWVKNVEIRHFSSKAIALYASINCEIRHNYVWGGGVGSGSEGVDLIGDCSWNLLEDNIVYEGGTINLNDGDSDVTGNVIAYNFLYGHRVAGASLQVFDIDLGHGTQDSFNLVEGNVIGCLMGGDSYFGGASHNTIFRNWITATNPYGYVDGRRAIMLKQYNVYTNVVGNVLGTSDFPTTNNGVVDGDTAPPYATGGYFDAPRVAAYDNGTSSHVSTIYEMGFPDIGNTGFVGTISATSPPDYTAEFSWNTLDRKYDFNVKATTARHANYHYGPSAGIEYESTDTNVVDHTDHSPPSSLYTTRSALIARGVVLGSLNFPAVDPTSPPTSFTGTDSTHPPITASEIIPAVWRFYHAGAEPGASPSPTPSRVGFFFAP